MKKKKLAIATNTLFCLMLGLTCFFSVIKGEKGFSETENRYLAQKPELTAAAVLDKSFMEEYEEYTADQFFLRDRWITLRTLAERILLKQDINGIYFAADDYFIEKHEKNIFQTELCERNIAALRAFTQKYKELLGNGQVVVSLVPSASLVLKEKLPPFAPVDGQQEFLKSVKEAADGTLFLDAEAVLSSHAKEYIYYRTDHHWTTLGAFYLYEEWAEKMGIEMVDFDTDIVSETFYGTLNSKVNVPMKADVITMYTPKSQVLFLMEQNQDGAIRNGLYDFDKLETRDQYAFFLGGNHALTRIAREKTKSSAKEKDGEKHLLIIKDSYAHSMAPFLAMHYDKVYLIDFRYFNGSLEEFVQNNQVTDLLFLYNTINFAQDRFLNKLNR